MKNNKEKESCTSMYGTYECHDPMHKDKGDFCAHCLFENFTWEQYLEKQKNPRDYIRKLYKLEISGWGGDITGMFYATEKEIRNLIGKEINFGEVLGRFSEIKVIIKNEHINVVSEDQEFLDQVQKKKIKLEIGYNPFEYFRCSRCGEKLDLETGECKKCKIKEEI